MSKRTNVDGAQGDHVLEKRPCVLPNFDDAGRIFEIAAMLELVALAAQRVVGMRLQLVRRARRARR